MAKYTRAFRNKDGSITYMDKDGNKYFRKGGSRAWRCNNPGNLDATAFAKRHGSIGADNREAIFPDYETGHQALAALLHGSTYSKLSIYDAIFRYAPPSENDTADYRRNVQQWTGLDISRKISSLNDSEFEKVVKAVERMEGWQPGKENSIKKVIKTKTDAKGKLSEFLLEGETEYISKAVAIQRAEEYEIDAVVVRPGNSEPFIRAFADTTAGNNFSSIVEA